ncbi:monosaccharide ABC transporter substrate-binding protein (CUT2 family) [Herbinix hemicellulosilytica]|uniref:Putative secreted protein n=1 Tax=Herbinix hemicellulosilytica TaxID=1564487 RepID=A0A0H5SGB8_HERHM|nr:sugar ABC transporter substrate-binding protein [Herbinix hemicellulosilytica]RBP58353.1 monosaccharide ABC transporter substrate-binding protein (CUT2 family) [Herbinix hemicellulosilytica]CRZ34070.1 putative secreted protein [Herbinix hemicellulosilytica]
MKVKKLLALALCFTMCLGLFAACGKNNNDTAKDIANTEDAIKDAGEKIVDKAEDLAGEKEHYTFGYTCMDGTNPFFVTLEKTIREEVEKRGDKLISTDPANDVTLQITQIEDMITQGIDAIFLNPVEAEGILPALDMLKEAGIPIINFDTEVADLSYVEAYVGSDNYNAGFVCGLDLVAKRPEGGPIIVLDSPTMNSITDRVKGFLDAIEGKGFTVVAQQDAKGNLEVAMGIAEDLLQAHSDVVAIFGGNDPTALGALAAANAAGLTDCLIYGVDGSPDIKAEIASGNSLIEGTGAQSPINIAKISVEVMYKYMSGEQVEDRYPVETFLITADNVNDFGTTDWQ